MSAHATKPNGMGSQLSKRDPASQRRANVRTALAFASIALVFFFGVILARALGSTTTGMSVVAVAVIVFLVAAIGRTLRKR